MSEGRKAPTPAPPGLKKPAPPPAPPPRGEIDTDDAGQTHYDGCWKARGHHNCARNRIRVLEAQINALPTFTADDPAFLRRWTQAWDAVCDLSGADKGAVAFSAKELAGRIDRALEARVAGGASTLGEAELARRVLAGEMKIEDALAAVRESW